MSLSLSVVAFFGPRAFLACEGKRRSSFAHKREEQLSQIRPAIDLDVLPGDEARPGTAEEAHGGGDVGGLAAPAPQRLHERMMLRPSLPPWARPPHQPRRH